ncbi:MAG TPA: tetratricopeptide repeat protein [Myxococcaceae bacterium]|nr:tetratricopeptide repeat protein [Myxococcaceae bacterium]
METRRSRPTAPSTGRVRLFRAVTVVLAPVVVLGGLELVLRMAGIGHPTGFTVPCEVQGHAAACPNPDFALRFFPPALARQPTPFVIPAEKGPRTFRVVVLGESAAQGDPEPTFGVARFLQAMLEEALPGVRIEVVNAGLVAINSHALVEMARDLARQAPDVAVVYAGNNEVVGPFGPGTVLTGRPPGLFLVRASLALGTTRIGQLLGALGRQRKGSPTEWRGMELFLDHQVRAEDPAMAQVYRGFGENLAEVITAFRERGARVVVSTAGTRLRDFAPFASAHRPGLDPSSLERFQAAVGRGDAAERAQRPTDALLAYREAEAIDPAFAELQYRLGRAALAAGDEALARERLSRARDLDTLRFRADGRLVQLTTEVARTAGSGVELVDGAAALAAASPHGLPGSELFWEHAHLTPEGNEVLARALFPAVVRALPPPLGVREVAAPGHERLAERLALTGYNRYLISKEVLRRLEHPPFPGQIDHALHVEQAQQVRDQGARETFEETEARYQTALARHPDDPWLHWNHAILLDNRDVFLARRGEPDPGRAIPEYRQFLQSLPRAREARLRLAEAYLRLGRLEEAEAQCREVLRFRPGDAQAGDMLASLAGLRAAPRR